MEDSRARTLATLEAFLESQRRVLARTQADMHKLAALREDALESPEEFIENLDEKLDDPAFKMSEYEVFRVPGDIDWDLFASMDPSVFNKIQLPGPPPFSTTDKQRSPPSELQNFVSQAAKDILGDFKPFVPPPDEPFSPDEDDAANDLRLAELVSAGKPIGTASEKPAPRRRPGSGLRLKHENEALTALAAGWHGKDDKTGLALVASPTTPCENMTPQVRLRSQRVRRPTMRAEEMLKARSPSVAPLCAPSTPQDVEPPVITPATAAATDDTDVQMQDGEEETQSQATPTKAKGRKQDREPSKPPRRRGAPSETFNLPWTPEEQNHLERLLEEIPAGEKNRWAKISKAMAGKRTPRQVASRVQKYFEKLRKFGVEPG
ncbi:hypothetical protein M422DRAFT_256637 [Sphaerobolus stellatus SS14]|uniref:Myb-like domain-containing protein n=1 Tax=Sphaerobolus stellatus (strain SS14) TaxID=990650 RepID=A0A0C9VQE6_SPHS4|nr:hypothetical protein M422DRAFT_256637 [Sphaerobolus stellatus SS14]